MMRSWQSGGRQVYGLLMALAVLSASGCQSGTDDRDETYSNSPGVVSKPQGDAHDNEDSEKASAVAVLVPVGGSGVRGEIRFEQQGVQMVVTGRITGLRPGAHGLFVHEYGDLTDGREGRSIGGHYAPRGMPHGGPDEKKRHIGDLGNIAANGHGVAEVDKANKLFALTGEHSILGRSIAVHAAADKFTQPDGDTGSAVAFAVIGLANPETQ